MGTFLRSAVSARPASGAAWGMEGSGRGARCASVRRESDTQLACLRGREGGRSRAAKVCEGERIQGANREWRERVEV